jgi:ABC-type molybdenum transport system ATPase subunit/photorepair protein PhrA
MLRLEPCGKGQQSDVASLLDGAGKATLVRGADTGEAARHNLATLGHKALQQADIAVRNRINLLSAELANLLATEELATSTGATTGTTTAGSTLARTISARA